MLVRRALIVVSAAAVLSAAAAPAAARPVPLSATEAWFVHAVNAARVRHSLPPLQLDARLQGAARAHSVDMIRRRYFAHGDFVRRLLRSGARGPVVGENLGWSKADGSELQRLMRFWLGSRKHRAVMLRRGFDRVGIGVARGLFKGWAHTIVVTADFEGN
jgi:uncharacterized protein YkwD